MFHLQRCALVTIIFCLSSGVSSAVAGDRRDCAELNPANSFVLPQAIYVPPLVEDDSYSITSPGHLSDAHRLVFDELLDRARCVAEAQRLPFAALRLTVFAHTDDRGARQHILDELRRRGVKSNQLNTVGRSVVDVVAAWHRARVVVERLRDVVSRELRADPSLGNVDPVGMVQPSDLTSEEPTTAGQIFGAHVQPHPRSFLVVIAARENLPANLNFGTPTISTPTISTPAASTAAQPPIIYVSCCDECGGKNSHNQRDGAPRGHGEGTSGRWLGPPQLDVLLGAAIGAESYTRTYLYREIAWLGVGVRLPIRRLELGVRLGFLAGQHSVLFNDIQQEQLRLGVGAALQIGILLLKRDTIRLALGADVGWLYMFRRIERIDHPFVGTVDTKHVHAPQGSGWLRFDVPIPWLPRLAFATELALGIIPFPTENEAPVNLTAKALGGITYALR